MTLFFRVLSRELSSIPQPKNVYRQTREYSRINRETNGLDNSTMNIFFENSVPTTLGGLVSSAIQKSFSHEVICPSQNAPFKPIRLSWVSLEVIQVDQVDWLSLRESYQKAHAR